MALKTYEKGLKAIKNNDYETAIVLFKKAVSLEPDDKKVRIGMMYYDYAPNEKLRYCIRVLEKRSEGLVLGSTVDTEGPEINLITPVAQKDIRLSFRHKDILVKGTLKDASNISWVKINQMSAPVEENGNFQKRIPIVAGLNEIVIEAADVFGNQTRYSFTVEKKKTRTKIPDFYNTSFAIVIGIDDYENWPVLNYAVNNALAVKQKLEEIGFREIVTLLDREAVKDRILDELHYNLTGKAGVNDLVLVYFSGHGQNEDASTGRKNSYLVPADSSSADLLRSVISIEQLKDISDGIPAKHILYIIDSCMVVSEAGGLKNASPQVVDRFEAMAPEKIVHAITACNAGEHIQTADNTDLFTRYLLRALEGESDINNDGFILCSELEEYLHTHVSKDTRQKQNPHGSRLEGRGELFLLESID
ncbi:MAG: caspase family protein [Candidatus Kuenenia sp.]|nr:caspase family protein [Candidatus Kuenenia hertensis]